MAILAVTDVCKIDEHTGRPRRFARALESSEQATRQCFGLVEPAPRAEEKRRPLRGRRFDQRTSEVLGRRQRWIHWATHSLHVLADRAVARRTQPPTIRMRGTAHLVHS